MRKISLALTLAISLASPAHSQTAFPFDVPSLKEEAKIAGIEHSYNGPWEYFVGGGVASFDCNGDRMPDLFFAGGTEPAKLFVNRSQTGGQLSFTNKELSIKESDLTKVLGAYPVNINNDAHTDLVVLRLGKNIVLRGKGECSFEVANKEFAFDGGRAWSTSFAATWEGNNDFPTLAIGNYVDRTAPGSPWGTCENNKLMRPTSLLNFNPATVLYRYYLPTGISQAFPHCE